MSFKVTRNVILNTLALAFSIAWVLGTMEYIAFNIWAVFMSLWLYSDRIEIKLIWSWVKKQLKDNSF